MNFKEYQEHKKRMQEDPEYKERWIKEQEAERKRYFLKLKPFKVGDDVPELPNVEEKEWREFYVPLLIEKGAIPKKDLIDGVWYYGDHRRCNFAKWNEKENQFDYIRYKFGYFWDCCNHFEDDDGFALFVPIRKASPDEIQAEENNLIKK